MQFLYLAQGSLAEIETQLIIAKKLGYLKEDKMIQNQNKTIRKMLSGLINHLKNK